MAYSDDEASVADSAPVELYKFAGTYAMYAYTSGPADMDFDDGNGLLTYKAIAVERTEVKIGTQDDDSTDLTVKMSVIQQLVIDYGFTTSPPDLTLTIYRIQPTGFGIYWHGPVTNISVDDQARASLNCPSSLGAALVGNVPNVYYQTPCNNVLYDVRCKVDYATYSFITSVSAVSADGKTVTVAGIGTLDGKLIGGELALGTGEIRMITAQVGDAITVNFPYNTIDVGGACAIAAGCDHMYRGDCKNKFNNQVNFNGFMFIPPDNPFTTGIDQAKSGVSDTSCVYVYVPPVVGAADNFGVMSVETDLGTCTPAVTPWSWQITFKRGGVVQATIYNSDGGYTAYDGGSDSLHPLLGWSSKYLKAAYAAAVGEPGWATDPFAAGPPTEVDVAIQWPYNNVIFPAGCSADPGGQMTVSLDLPQLGFSWSSPQMAIFGLWPANYTFAIP